jgi:phytoene synthase
MLELGAGHRSGTLDGGVQGIEEKRLLYDQLPPPQRLAMAYASSRGRPATLALLALDARLAAILRGRHEPIAAQLRLAWWRDTLASPVPDWPGGEPLLEALSAWRDPAALRSLAEGWEALLAEKLSFALIAEFIDGRGQAFAALARELGTDSSDEAAAAAQIWATADLAANVSDGSERDLVIAHGRDLPRPPRLSRSLRPLAVLSGLGAAALAEGGRPLLSGPRDVLRALRIGVTGR